jgi:aryl-alcohol dehydrogenase-like predicted oxidoreductase
VRARAGSDPVQDDLYGRDEDYDVAEAVAALADERGLPAAQVALAWLLHQPSVVPIVGASRAGHIEDAAAAAELTLTPEEIARLEAPYRPNSVRGHG